MHNKNADISDNLPPSSQGNEVNDEEEDLGVVVLKQFKQKIIPVQLSPEAIERAIKKPKPVKRVFRVTDYMSLMPSFETVKYCGLWEDYDFNGWSREIYDSRVDGVRVETILSDYLADFMDEMDRQVIAQSWRSGGVYAPGEMELRKCETSSWDSQNPTMKFTNI